MEAEAQRELLEALPRPAGGWATALTPGSGRSSRPPCSSSWTATASPTMVQGRGAPLELAVYIGAVHPDAPPCPGEPREARYDRPRAP